MPSRKVISVLIVAIGLVASILLISRPEGSLAKSKTNLVSGSLVSGPEIKTDETNWQAELAAQTPSSVSLNQENQSSSNETLTDQLSRSLFANYFSMKQSGSLDNTSATNLVDQAADFVDQPTKTQYSLKDILVSSDNGKMAITKYGNDLGLAFKQNGPPKQNKDEIEIFKEMLQNKKVATASELRNIAKIYNNMALALSKITVPSSFIEPHLQITNNFATIADAVSGMSYGLEDPVKALVAIGEYRDALIKLGDARGAIQKQILKMQVVYKQGENGYFFYFGI